MKRTLIFAIGLMLAACSGGGSTPAPPPVQPPAHVKPGTPAWQMIPGTWAEYANVEMKGVYANGYIAIQFLGATLGEFRITNLPYGDTAIARVYGQAGVDVTTVPADLTGTLVEESDGFRIGEAANSGARHIWPPEPLVTATPHAGEIVPTQSMVLGSMLDYQTQYWTHQVGMPDVDGFHNVVVTGLVEQPFSATPTAYTHVFDGELAELWFGPVAADGSVTGYLYRRLRTGSNQ